MNKVPVYLYSNTLGVILDLDLNRNINHMMYQRKIKIQKGFKDTIQIQFRNSDQKMIPLSTATNYVFDMIDSAGRQLVLSKAITNRDDGTFPNRGLAEIPLDPIDTINLQAGDYKFVVKKDNGDGSYTPAYSNTYYGITGDIELVEDGYPIGFPVQTIVAKQIQTGQEFENTIGNLGWNFFSQWLRPLPHATTTATSQSVQFDLNMFAGDIIVQGTLDASPSSAGNANAAAFTIATYTSATPTSAPIQLSWNNSVTAVRFKIRPRADGAGQNYYPTGNPVNSNINKFPSGFIDKIQYFS